MYKTALAASVGIFGVIYLAYNRIHENIIVHRFPDLDPNLVRKAYRTMMSRAFRGDYAEMDDSDETMDRIFLAIVKEQTASK